MEKRDVFEFEQPTAMEMNGNEQICIAALLYNQTGNIWAANSKAYKKVVLYKFLLQSHCKMVELNPHNQTMLHSGLIM